MTDSDAVVAANALPSRVVVVLIDEDDVPSCVSVSRRSASKSSSSNPVPIDPSPLPFVGDKSFEGELSSPG